MTRNILDVGEKIKWDEVTKVSLDVDFISSKFPDYKIGSDYCIIDSEDVPQEFSMQEIAAKESELLLEQKKRLSVRDLAKIFENGLFLAKKISLEVNYPSKYAFQKKIIHLNISS